MFNNVPAAAAAAAMMPWSFSPETICESAARLLFMNVRWAKSVPAFTTLPSRDQIVLLEESWRELFVLGAAQFTLPIEAGTLMTALGLSSSPFGMAGMPCPTAVSTERQLGLLSEIKAFQETVAKFKQMNVDPTEYACLRAVILFKTCKLLIRCVLMEVLQYTHVFFYINSCWITRHPFRYQFTRPSAVDAKSLRLDGLS